MTEPGGQEVDLELQDSQPMNQAVVPTDRPGDGQLVDQPGVQPGQPRLAGSDTAAADFTRFKEIQVQITRIGYGKLPKEDQDFHNMMDLKEKFGGLGLKSKYDLSMMTFTQWKETDEGKFLKYRRDSQAKPESEIDTDAFQEAKMKGESEVQTFQRLSGIHDYLKARDEAAGHRN